MSATAFARSNPINWFQTPVCTLATTMVSRCRCHSDADAAAAGWTERRHSRILAATAQHTSMQATQSPLHPLYKVHENEAGQTNQMQMQKYIICGLAEGGGGNAAAEGVQSF